MRPIDKNEQLMTKMSKDTPPTGAENPRRLSQAIVAATPEASLSECAYQAIREAFRRSEYSSGDRIIEGDLARALNVSRTPVREALRRLEDDGLVTPAGRKGYVVADLMADVEHVFLMRERLEGLAAALAAQAITLPELEHLKELQSEMESLLVSPPDLERMVDLNSAFHSSITLAARSPRLERSINRLHPEYLSYQVVRNYNEDEMRRSVIEHREIVDALWNRDMKLADSLIQSHLEHGKAVVFRELSQASASPRPVTVLRKPR
jgi:DNA-binding GntR family transcriptional regulator